MSDDDYVLTLSEVERDRHRRMAGHAVEDEAAEWAAAGIAPGARVADVGCGPGGRPLRRQTRRASSTRLIW